VGEESYSKGQSKKYLIPDVGPSWCIDPCKLRTEQNETYGSFITLNDMAILAYLRMCFSSGWYVSRSSNLAMLKAERNRHCELYPLGSILLRLDSFSVEW